MSICCVSICPSHAKISTVHNLMYVSVGGVTVSIVAFQAVDPGSTPGQRIFCSTY